MNNGVDGLDKINNGGPRGRRSYVRVLGNQITTIE